MHDIRAIRDNPQAFDAGLARRFLPPAAAAILAWDGERRTAQTALQEIQAFRNALSRRIGESRRRGEDTAALEAEVTAKRAEMEALEKQVAALDKTIFDTLAAIPNILDPDTAPEVWLDSILADLGNPFTFELTATDKRRLAQILVDIYRSKGTGPGIVNAIRLFLGIEVTLNVPGWSPLGLGDAAIGESWILGSSDEEILLTFQIRVTDLLSAEQQQRLLAIVDYMSDAREFFILLQPDQPPVEPDHWSLGFSNLGFTTLLHA